MLEIRESTLFARTSFYIELGTLAIYEDDDISHCTDSLDMLCTADAGHITDITRMICKALLFGHLWMRLQYTSSASKQMIRLGNGQRFSSRLRKFGSITRKILSTNHVRICQDPELWYDQNVRDLDINRLHREMIGCAQFYMLGDVIRMRTTTGAAFSYASGRREPSINAMHEACLNLFRWIPSGRVASTSQGLHGSCPSRRISAELHGS
jgi:hypothetical protein